MRLHSLRPGAMICALAAALGVAVDSAHAGTVHDVAQQGTSFVPADIAVTAGDTIRWTRSSGTHTVTSGASCTPDGVHFNEPLNAVNPVVEWQVPGDLEGVIPYFCMPHCGFNMTGTITVEGAGCPADVNGDGDVGFSDVLGILSTWGPCPGCPADLDGNGSVGFADLLMVLSTWGPC